MIIMILTVLMMIFPMTTMAMMLLIDVTDHEQDDCNQVAHGDNHADHDDVDSNDDDSDVSDDDHGDDDCCYYGDRS